MTRTEAKQAFKEGAPIICRINGIEHEYQHISAVIYRKTDGLPEMAIELYDACGNSVIIAKPSTCQIKKQ